MDATCSFIHNQSHDCFDPSVCSAIKSEPAFQFKFFPSSVSSPTTMMGQAATLRPLTSRQRPGCHILVWGSWCSDPDNPVQYTHGSNALCRILRSQACLTGVPYKGKSAWSASFSPIDWKSRNIGLQNETEA